MRLWEAGVPESARVRAHSLAFTRRDDGALLGGTVLELRNSLELIASERHAHNVSLASIIAAQRAARAPAEVPARKTA
jgi:hypothetical protein